MILQGTVKTNPGADRNMVALDHLTFTLPNGRTVDKEISGIVVDEIDGIGGMLAQYNRHLDKIVPEAGILAVTQGVASGLKSTQQTQIVVVPGSTSQVTQSGSAARAGVGGGLAAGADVINDYEKQYLSSISPTCKTPNGQKLTAYFFATIEFPDVSDVDWGSIVSGEYGHRYDGF